MNSDMRTLTILAIIAGCTLLPRVCGAGFKEEVDNQEPKQASTIVGAWKGVQNASDTITFANDKTLTIKSDQNNQPMLGLYETKGFVGLNKNYIIIILDMKINKESGVAHESYEVALMRDDFLVLLNGPTLRVYRRISGDKMPPTNYVQKYKARLVGDWKNVYQPQAAVSFRADGKLLIDGALLGHILSGEAGGGLQGKTMGFYNLRGDQLTFVINLQDGVANQLLTIRPNIVFIDDQRMILIIRIEGENIIRPYILQRQPPA